MRVDVIMPQMGESIAEGTISRWIKQVGDSIERDEPLFEITTDKVDAEIPAPSAGTLVEIRNKEGDTVPVNEVVAVIETEADKVGEEGEKKAEEAEDEEKPAAEGRETQKDEPSRTERAEITKEPVSARDETEKAAPPPRKRAPSPAGKAFVSPVVRRIADEHDIDPSRVPGTGAGGRVTKKDILRFIEQGGRAAAEPEAAAETPAPASAPGARVERVPMSQMRKKIAEHMVQSRQTSAHVNSVFEVDMTRVVGLRDRYKNVYTDRHGVKLTYTPFFVKAACDALRAWPVVNSSLEGEEIVYKKDLNVGIAVALDWGLIVPVIRNADELSMAGLSKKTADLAERARNKKLSPEEVQGGTFTITNPGAFGGLFGLPIINQPQVAIMGIGGIEKRPVVVDEAIAIRSMMYLSMSYDHRVIDGAVADQFLARVKAFLQEFDEAHL